MEVSFFCPLNFENYATAFSDETILFYYLIVGQWQGVEEEQEGVGGGDVEGQIDQAEQVLVSSIVNIGWQISQRLTVELQSGSLFE